MLQHYLVIAFRNLSRNKTLSLINILGLAIGMGVCLLIYQYIHFESSFDKFHRYTNNTYRLTQTDIRNGENLGTDVFTTSAIGIGGKENIPEIIDFVRIRPLEFKVVTANTKKGIVHLEEAFWYVDHNFLLLFNFPLKYGDPTSALNENHSVVITEQMATKYFGETNPVGKSLQMKAGVLSGEFIVSGVLQKLPNNSHLQFNFLLPINFLLANWEPYKNSNGWANAEFVTYVKVDKTVDLKLIGKKFDELIQNNIGQDLSLTNTTLETGFQQITDIHLRSGYLKNDPASHKGNLQNVQFFVIIAIFILAMAWVNYINLATASSMPRSKEVGIRKSIGALKSQLVSQFIVESVLINFISSIIAIGITYLTLPILNGIIGKDLEFAIFKDPIVWIGFSALIIIGSLLSGLYPAFVLSSFRPVSIFKSVSITKSIGFNLRRTLIIFQFLASILLISGTYLVYKQINFMRHKDLGIEMEQILVLNGPRVVLENLEEEEATLESKYKVFKTIATNHHSISNVSASVTVPGKGYMFSEGFWEIGHSENATDGSVILADYDFPDTYNLDFLTGSSFSEEPHEEYLVIINEEAVKAFNLGSADEALYKKLTNGGDTLKIIGVVKNVHWNSLREGYVPTLYVLNNEYGAYFSLRTNLSDIPGSIAHIESAFHSVFPGDPFHYYFLDDDINNQYQSDLQFGNLFLGFSLLAVFLASLGLFALVSFSANARIKEIGIRKVFGAEITSLLLLLSKEYLLLLIISNIIAIPLVVVGAKYWLENYAFKVSIGIDQFIFPGLILVTISILTVSYKTFSAARTNPVNSLRSE